MNAESVITCMRKECASTNKEATKVLRFRFFFAKRGFSPKNTVGFLGVYVCDECATSFSANALRNENLKSLGRNIANSINADTLVWDKTEVSWVAKEQANKFFARVNSEEQRKSLLRQADLTANQSLFDEKGAQGDNKEGEPKNEG